MQLLSAIPFIGIGKLKASEVPSHMKDVVSITFETTFEMEQVFDGIIDIDQTPTTYTVIIEWTSGRVYRFVGKQMSFEKNVSDLGYKNPLYPRRIYYQILDYQINPASVVITTDLGKITVS